MSKHDIEALDSDSKSYPGASHIKVDDTEIKIGDLLTVFKNSDSSEVWFFERVYGFTWPGLITHYVGGAIPAEYRTWESLVEGLESGKIVRQRIQTKESYYRDEDTVRTLSYYRYVHQDGWQSVVVSELRRPMEQEPFEQTVSIYDSVEEMIEDIYTPADLLDHDEAESVYNFLIGTDAGKQDVLDPDDLPTSNQSDLESFD